jgi:hypothetical protein
MIYIFYPRMWVWGPPGLLAIGSCCWVIWGLRSLNTAFPCWSCFSYFSKLIWLFTCQTNAKGLDKQLFDHAVYFCILNVFVYLVSAACSLLLMYFDLASVDPSKFKIVLVHVKCWSLLKPLLWGVDGSLHLTVPSMNRLNQTEPATFSVLPCWTFFRDSYFLYFSISICCFCTDFQLDLI